MSSLVKDLSDGVKLIQLMVCYTRIGSGIELTIFQEIMGTLSSALFSNFFRLMIGTGDVSLGRYNKTPRMRVQKAENVNKALEFITSRGVKLTNIGPEGKNHSD